MRKATHLILLAMIMAGCSTTSNLPEGEVLYTGLDEIKYLDDRTDDNSAIAKEEVEAALACAPNGSLLGSSSLRSPFQFKLWIYNAYANSTSKFGTWMRNTFGSEPVLMSNVNPEVRALVAKNVLKAYGYFGANVTSREVATSNPKKAKLAYDVTMGDLYRIDTLKFLNFPSTMDSIVNVANATRTIHSGDGFSISTLDAERTRLSNLLRNNGFYYYRSDYGSFVADSISNPGKVEVHLQPVSDMPDNAKKQWYLGKLRIDLRKTMGEKLNDSISHRFLSVHFNGKKPPIKLRTILRDMSLRPRQLFSQNNYSESLSQINSLGLFSLTNFSFTPRDTTAACDTLDMVLNCVFDKPYDGSIEANYSIKSNDLMGPGIVVGLTKRNAFRGGEKLTLSLKGSYEWQTRKGVTSESDVKINSYEYGADLSLEYPRLETPFKLFQKHRFYKSPTTTFSLSYDVQNRSGLFNMRTFTAAATYKFRTSATSSHELSPLMIDYTHYNSMSDEFLIMGLTNPSLLLSMTSQFVPKIKYTYTYTSPSNYRNPITWETTITEAGNLMSLGYMAAGKKFNEKDKTLVGEEFAQFLKINTSLKKTWTLTPKSQLVGRVEGGIMWAYGNSEETPYSEQFYVGGANSIRAFTVRSIGPGRYLSDDGEYSFLYQVGDMKLLANLEYRFNIFGSLYGAAFLDAGNVWMINDEYLDEGNFTFSKFFKQIATGTGVGLRYDLDFFVLRFDVGIGIHVPYDTGKSGYYNIPKFSNGLGYHLAIGYPF